MHPTASQYRRGKTRRRSRQMNKLIKGQKYDVSTLMLEGWTDEQTATDGAYQLRNYFDAEGRYLGPDAEGVEPIVSQG